MLGMRTQRSSPTIEIVGCGGRKSAFAHYKWTRLRNQVCQLVARASCTGIPGETPVLHWEPRLNGGGGLLQWSATSYQRPIRLLHLRN